MKEIYILFSLLLSLLVNSSNAQYVWTQKADFGGGSRYGATGFSIGTQIYIGTGITHIGSNYTYYTDFWAWDQSTNIWTQKANFTGSQRYDASGFSIGQKGYITLGWSPSALNDLWEYDPSSNSWTQKMNFGGSARYDAASFVIGNYAYVGIGYAPYYSDFWQYDPSVDTWTQVADIGGSARSAAVGFAIDSFGYVACGGTQGVYYSTDLWRYNPSSNSWLQMSSFIGQGRVAPAAFAINGNGYVGNGCNDNSVFNDFYAYDPITDSWSPIANFPGQGVVKSRGYSIGIYGYVGTGSDGVYPGGTDRADLWQYGPVAAPVASFQSSDSSICTNSCINFTDQSSNATSWLWVFAGSNTILSTDQNPQNICYANPGEYDVTLVVSNGGQSDTLTLSNYITVNPAPVAPVITTAHDTLYCSTDAGYSSYQWYYFNGAIPGATDTFLVAYYRGNYNVDVTNKSGCSIAVGIDIVLGISEQQPKENFEVYPNPVNDNLIVHVLNPYHDTDVEITDITGRKIYQRVFDSAKGNNLQVDFSGFEAGTYFISVVVDTKRMTKKIMKQSSSE